MISLSLLLLSIRTEIGILPNLPLQNDPTYYWLTVSTLIMILNIVLIFSAIAPCQPSDIYAGKKSSPFKALNSSDETDKIILKLVTNNCTNQCIRREFSTFETLNEIDLLPLNRMLNNFNLSVNE